MLFQSTFSFEPNLKHSSKWTKQKIHFQSEKAKRLLFCSNLTELNFFTFRSNKKKSKRKPYKKFFWRWATFWAICYILQVPSQWVFQAKLFKRMNFFIVNKLRSSITLPNILCSILVMLSNIQEEYVIWKFNN